MTSHSSDSPSPRIASPALASASASPRWTTALLCLVLALLVYFPAAMSAEFLGFDDNYFFGPDNPEFRDGLGAVFDPSRPIANAYLPVAHASLWLDWRLAGASAFWPHVHALLLHALVGFVLVRLLLVLGASRLVAHVAGALFVVHPALAESVAWVSGRKDLLSGLFTFAALHQVARFAARPHALRLFGIALLAALAMYSKATAVVLPLLAALVCAFVGGSRAKWWTVAVALAVVVPASLHHQAIAAAQGTLQDGAWTTRAAQVPGVFAHYLATSVWPVRLNVLYPEVDTLAAFRDGLGGGAACLALFAAATALAWWRPAWRLVGAGLAAFAIALLPFNTAFPASAIAAADRYLYMAIPGLALAVAAAAARWHARGPWLAAVAALPLAWLAGGRAHVFADDESLWRASLAAAPDNAVAHLNLVHDRLQRGPAAYHEVREHLEAAVRAARYPIHEVRARELLVTIAVADADYALAATHAREAIAAAARQRARETSTARIAEADAILLRSHLAAFEPLQLAGDDVGAEAALAGASALAPEHPDVIAFAALRELARCRPELLELAKAGKQPVLAADDARGAATDRQLAAARERHPAHAGLACAQAEWDRARDQAVAAMRWYTAAQRADPKCLRAWLGAARLLREREQWPLAEQHAREGLRVRSDPALRQELALALVGQGKLDDAEMHLEAFLRVHPNDRDTAKVLSNVLVGRAYAKLSDPAADRDAVVRLIERALTYNPGEVRAHVVMGQLYKDAQQFANAVRHLERAYKQMPDFAEARQLYVDCLAALGWKRLAARDEDGAAAAWRRCVDVAPADYDSQVIRDQLQRLWTRHEGEGVRRMAAGETDAAAVAFRKCLAIDPKHHWGAWQLALALRTAANVDLAELEALCRQAVDGQRQHGLDRSKQVLLLAQTLARAGKDAEAKRIVAEYVAAPDADADASVIAALRRL